LGSDRLTVRLAENLTEQQAQALLEASALVVVRRLRFAPNLFQVRVKPGPKHFLNAALDLSADPRFLYAEPEFIEHIPGRFTPTDPGYPDQWHLNNTGQMEPGEGIGNGIPGADIGAQLAWNTTRGSGVRVAIVDNGFDLSHPDLPAVTANSAYFSRDAVTRNVTFVQGTNGYPPGDHGTLCAGMAIARADNACAGCGVAHLAEFMAVSCADDELDDQVTLARAIAYATDPRNEVATAGPNSGADVISCSLGSPNLVPWQMTTVLRDAIDAAVNNGRGGKGTPVFWAVNNGPMAISLDEVCAHPNTIAVGRSNRLDLKDNSAHGPELDFLATGVWVRSTSVYGTFRTVVGTSFAAPVAAGVAALILSRCPSLTFQQVRQIMRDTCRKIGGVVYNSTGHNVDYGYGRVDAAAAVQHAAALCPAHPIPQSTLRPLQILSDLIRKLLALVFSRPHKP
jgi:thermitase